MENEGIPKKVEVTALEAIERRSIDVAISTAKAYPRMMAMCRKKLIDLIPDKEAAHGCFFAVPRGGKTIRGPSVRLSEAMAAAYGNLNMGARIIEVGSKQVVAQGIGHN